MKFLHQNAKGEIVELPVRVERGPEYQEIYAHGAFGAPMANYHFRIDFYRDEFPPIQHSVVGNELVAESVSEVERRVLTSVYVSMPFLKELRNWLDKRVQDIESLYGEIQLPKSEDEDSKTELPKVKEA